MNIVELVFHVIEHNPDPDLYGEEKEYGFCITEEFWNKIKNKMDTDYIPFVHSYAKQTGFKDSFGVKPEFFDEEIIGSVFDGVKINDCDNFYFWAMYGALANDGFDRANGDLLTEVKKTEEIIKTKILEYRASNETVFIKYISDDIEHLRYIDGKSDWIDLRASETKILKAGEFALIPLGVAMKLPDGYEAHILPRSSTFKNYGILMTNSMGVVDNSYASDDDVWKMPVWATRDTTINKGDRICQFRIMKNQPHITFVGVNTLGGVSRGGFGSTGVN